MSGESTSRYRSVLRPYTFFTVGISHVRGALGFGGSLSAMPELYDDYFGTTNKSCSVVS